MSKPASKARIGSAIKSVRRTGGSSASSDAGSDAGSAAGRGASAASAIKFASDAGHDGGSSSSRSSSKAVVKQVAAASLVPETLEDRQLQLAEIDPSRAEANGKATSSFAMASTKSEKMKNVLSTAVADGQLVFDKKEPWTQEEREAYIRKKVGDSVDMPTLRFLDKAIVGAPLPDPWATNRDRKGRLYFVNEEEQDPAKKSSWKHPHEDTMVELAPMAQSALATDTGSRQSYVQELHAYWTQEAEEKLAKWADAEDANGTTYYYNSETLETMWENPAETVLPEYRVKLNAIAMLVDEDHLAEFLAEQSPEVAQVQGSSNIEPAALPPVAEEVDNTALTEPAPLHQGASGHLDVIATRTSNDSAVGHLVERVQVAKPDEDHQNAISVALLSHEIASIREENARLQREALEAQEKARAATAQALEAERMQHDARQAQEAQAQAAAEATALGGERLQELLKQHQQSTYQQEEWQQEREVLHAEAKAAAEAKVSEEVRQQRSNFQQEEWQREREALHAEVSSALEQKVAARAKAQAAAEAKILEEERLLHQRSTFQQEGWQREREALHAEFRSALEQQEGHQAEAALLREQLEATQLRPEGVAEALAKNNPQEEWQREREALHAEFRSALEQQEAHQAEAALLREQLEATQLRPEGVAEAPATPLGSPRAADRDTRLPSLSFSESCEPLLPGPAPLVNIIEWPQQDLTADPRRPTNSNPVVETLRYPHIETDILEELRQQQASSIALQELMQQQLEDVAQSCQHAVHLAESTAAETLHRLNEVAGGPETTADSPMPQKLGMEEAITHMQGHQDAMQQQFMSQVHETMNLHTSRLQEVNEVLALQGAGLLRDEATQARHAEQLRESLDVQSGRDEAAQSRLTQELRESFDAQHRRDEATQSRLTEELRESLEAQRAMLSEAQACSELAAKRQTEEAVESKAKARRDFEKEIQQALEEKQRQATEANNALAEALQKQVKDTFAPLAQHVHDAERRQQDSLSAAQAQKDRAQKEELSAAKEAEQRTREMQASMELAVQDQISKAMDSFKGQLQVVERARSEDAERAKRAEIERRACMEDEKLARQQAEQKAQRDLKEQEERRKADTARLEEELRTSREGALKRREEELRRQMVWRDESREMQWRAENRELEWKSEVRQMEWQMDWQKAKLVEESELLRTTDPVLSDRRSRSNSRVRRELLDSVAAAQGNLSDLAPPNRHPGSKPSCAGPGALALKVPGGRASARSVSAGSTRQYKDKWEEAEDCIERLVDHAVPTTVATGLGFRVDLSAQDLRSHRAKRPAGSGSSRNSRNSSRPSSAVPLSRRSLAEEVAADLDGLAPMDTSLSPQDSARDECNALATRKAIGQQSSSSGMSYRDVASTLHSTKWFEQQRSKQKGSKAKGAKVLCLDQVRSAYPEVSQILAVGAF